MEYTRVDIISRIRNWCVNNIYPIYISDTGQPSISVNVEEINKIKNLIREEERKTRQQAEQIEFNYWKNMFNYISTYQLHREELQHVKKGWLDTSDTMLYHFTGMGIMSVPSRTNVLLQTGVLVASVVSALLQLIKANNNGGISVYAQLIYIFACLFSMEYLYSISKIFAFVQVGSIVVAAWTIYGVTISEETRDTAWSQFP